MTVTTKIPHFHFEPDHLDGVARQLFQPSGVDGVYGRTGEYESVIDGLAALITSHRPDSAEIV